MTAKEFLSQYRTLNAEINAKLDEAAQIRALAERVTPSEQCGGSGTVSDRVGHGAARLVDLEREIEREVDRLVDMREEIVARIRGVPEYNQRMVLQLRYINGWKFERIAKNLSLSKRQIRNHHSQAIENFQKVLDISP